MHLLRRCLVAEGAPMAGIDHEVRSTRLARMMDGVLVAQLIHVVAELGIADLLRDQPMPVAQLARRTGTDPDALYRALRALAGEGVFTESGPRTFGLTPLAEPLRTDAPDSVRNIARMRGGREHWLAWAELQHSIRTGSSAFRHAHGTDLWTYLASHPDQAAVFDRAMGDDAQHIHAAAASVLDLSDVSRLVDVGGGHGYLVARLLRRYPELSAVVLDQPHTMQGAERVLAEAGVRDRCELVAGDFLDSVPTGGDAYVLSRILHDWDDQACLRVLGNIRHAMAAAGQVIVVDSVVPEGDTQHSAKLVDIIMLALNEGRERSEAELATLLEAARLRHTATLDTSSHISVIISDVQPGNIPTCTREVEHTGSGQ
ncbi:MAG: methyltransferase [Pseudonocardiaceae bacterium]|nr:methyltransferase [Pseudonocardiaceae bacterium]